MLTLRRPIYIRAWCGKTRASYDHSRNYANRSFDPLRILFCGSDIFSIASLDALHDASQNDRSFIESVEVVSRPGKWTGPGKKVFKEVAIADRARTLKLPLHQIDTFRGWTPPTGDPINIIIAVSFGLLVPRRLIESARYGGLNVHPSMLPDLWGAAPLQHTLLHNDDHTGITIQTLHPTTMDQGAILAQTPRPGLIIPENVRTDFSSITHHIAPRGADLLVQALKQGLFVKPIQDLSHDSISRLQGRQPRHAHKLCSEDRHIDWKTWSADQIIRRQKLLKTLWNTVETDQGPLKVVWSTPLQIEESGEQIPALLPGMAHMSKDSDSLIIQTADGQTVRVNECTVPGERPRNIRRVIQKHGFILNKACDEEDFQLPFN